MLEIVEATYTPTSSWPPCPAPVRGSNDPFLPALPMATDLCALARHATGTGSGTLLQTLQLIHHQQVRGSSPRVGSSVFKRLQTNSTKSQDNVSPWCHHIARAQRRLTHAPVRQPSPRTLHRCGREPRPHPLVPVAQLDRPSAF